MKNDGKFITSRNDHSIIQYLTGSSQKFHSPHLLQVCLILCTLKMWIPIPFSLPWGLVHSNTYFEYYQPQNLYIQPVSTSLNLFYFLWFFISCILLIHYAIQYLLIKQIVDCSIPLDKDIYESDQITTPFAYGIYKCKIIIPKNMNKKIISYVVQHENMHKRYFDNGWKLVVLFTCCVFWFHPMIWLVRYILNVDSEIVCDQRVVKSMAKNERQCYAHSILSYASTKSNIPSSCCSQFTSNYYKERIHNIMKYKKKSALTLAVSCVLAVGIISSCAINNETYTGDAAPASPIPPSETIQSQNENPNEQSISEQKNDLSPEITAEGIPYFRIQLIPNE